MKKTEMVHSLGNKVQGEKFHCAGRSPTFSKLLIDKVYDTPL